jgi:hypothetical protein
MHSDYSAQEMDVKNEGDFQVWRMKGMEIRFLTHGAERPRDAGQIALLKWDTSLFSAVAIDGQHRIAALKKFRDSSHPEAAISDVPATFLVFDPNLPKDKHLLNLVREIFVDVNHNAKIVDESRIILLDDREFTRKAARSCVLQAFDEQANPVQVVWNKLDEELPTTFLTGIPQELIDLDAGRQGADVKRMREWHYLSIFNLHRILKYFIFENRWRVFENVMGLGSLTEDDGPLGSAVAAKRDDDEEDSDGTDDDTFFFSPAIGDELIANFFDLQVRPLVMGVLTGIKPYRDLLEEARSMFATDHGPDLREFLIAESSVERGSQSALAENLRRDQPDLFATLQSMLKKLRRPDGWEADLIWYSVTQRAFFYEVSMTRRALEYFSAADAPKTLPHFVDRYVRALSALWEAGVFQRDYRPVGAMPLWFGSPLETKHGEIVIKPSDAAARRMARLIRILVAAFHAKENGWEPKDFFNDGLNGNSAGLKAAFTALKKNYEKYLSSDDVSRGLRPKKDSYYSDSAERRLKNLVRRAVFRIDTEPEPTAEETEDWKEEQF